METIFNEVNRKTFLTFTAKWRHELLKKHWIQSEENF